MAAYFVRTLSHLRKQFQCTTPVLFSIKSNSSFAIMYNVYGDPGKVLHKTEITVPSPGKGEVLIQMLAAPINPADINMIQGTYAIKPPLPAVGGNEGVGKVIQISPDVISLNIGDWVIPATAGIGTWRTHVVCKSEQLIKIANDIPLLSAATLAVNPGTAYRMLRDFENLKPGDLVIQNGANSAVGQAVIQIAKSMELHTINIIRQRSNLQELIDLLKNLGATHVVTEDFSRTAKMNELLKSLNKKPQLALNCVGGKSSTELLRHLGFCGTMVTYGGMSKEPVTVPTGLLIFKDVKVRGFWMSKWNEMHEKDEERYNMLNNLCDMIRKSTLKLPKCSSLPMNQFQGGIVKAMEPFCGEKQILLNENI